MSLISRSVIALAATGMAVFTACQNNAPKVAASKGLDSVYNAGSVKLDSFKHTFYIKSTGTADLKIDTVVSSCDCTVADWQRGTIKPGDSAYVNVSVKPDSVAKGRPVTKNIMVRTNASNPLTTFSIIYQL